MVGLKSSGCKGKTPSWPSVTAWSCSRRVGKTIDRGANLLNRPHKENDHLMDALRYALFSVEGTKKSIGPVGKGARILRSR